MIGRVYEAAAMPDLWPSVLTDLALWVGARGGLLFNFGGQRMTGTPETVEMGREFVAAGYMEQNHRPAMMLRSQHPGFHCDLDLCTEEQRRTLPMFTDFLIPRGYHLACGTGILGAGFEDLLITFEGFPDPETALGGVLTLDALRPHFARAATLSAQLRLEQARAAVAALRLMGVPAAMLTARGRLIAANELLEARLGIDLLDRRAGFQLKDRRADAELRRTLLAIEAGGFAGRSIALPGTEAAATGVLHLIPVTGVARDLFTSAAVLMILTTTEARPPPGTDLLQALFDLTPTEARVARAIGQGDTAAEIAETHGASVHTVRTQIKAVLAKSGVARQSDLARMLTGLGLPG